MMGCKKCKTINGVVLLVLGILFILVDFGVWAFWGIQWWSILLIWFGLAGVCMSKCPDCAAMCAPAKAGKRK